MRRATASVLLRQSRDGDVDARTQDVLVSALPFPFNRVGRKQWWMRGTAQLSPGPPYVTPGDSVEVWGSVYATLIPHSTALGNPATKLREFRHGSLILLLSIVALSVLDAGNAADWLHACDWPKWMLPEFG